MGLGGAGFAGAYGYTGGGVGFAAACVAVFVVFALVLLLSDLRATMKAGTSSSGESGLFAIFTYKDVG